VYLLKSTENSKFLIIIIPIFIKLFKKRTMKKQLLSIVAVLAVGSAFAQPSPSLNINQDAIFPNPVSVTNPGIKFLDAVDANVVWTIGYDAAAPQKNYNWWSKSTNGGSSFAGGNVYGDTNTYVVANMEGIDANTAWVSSYMKSTKNMGAIHRTTNGGASWQNMTATGMFTNTTAFTDFVSFSTSSIGIAVGDPVNNEFEIWRTTDGGLSWAMIPAASIPNPLSANEYAIVDLYYKLGSNLWFGTNQGRMYRTSDGGLTWNVSPVTASTGTLLEIAFSSPMNGICTAFNNAALELWNTTNGGATWSPITPIDPNFGANDICGVPGTNYLVSVDNANQIVSHSTDNGVTWNDWGSIGIGYVNCDFVSGSTGWVGSYDFQAYQNLWKYSGAVLSGSTAPTAAFSIPSNLCLSGPTASVQTVNTSTGTPALTYAWSSSPATAVFSSPTGTAPTITFASAGTYTIMLVATNGAGSNTVTQVINVQSCIAPVASFTVPTSGCTQFSFAAVNTSTGSPAPGYFWSIAPAAGVTMAPSANAVSPSFKMSGPGVYTITLVATNASGTASATQTINVTACPPNISFTVPSCIVPTFSTQNGTANPPGVVGTISYTWSISPNTGVLVTPNYFVANLTNVSLSNTVGVTYTVTLRARNTSGTSTLTQIMSDCTGLNESSLFSNLLVYPNPVRESFNLTMPNMNGTYNVVITDLLGSVIYSGSSDKDKVNVSMANNPKGVYFLTVEYKGEKATRKIILE
jgi:photosystem II stability/assembly factor-like uncharacterized protein